MTLRVEINGDGDQLLSLESALRGDADLRGTRITRVDLPPGRGELGPVTDALHWAAENPELMAALAAALTAWLAQRRTKVRVRVGEREVEVDSTRVNDPEELALRVLAALDEVQRDV
ncbi:hypothetical protein [Catellatospora sp. NPDC049609]|uniref:effector-associated constant component EACC1 n=1 Tax=Catellatospora sp. NPDC049609 TaxID=3155505 RepID=UPI00341CD56C